MAGWARRTVKAVLWRVLMLLVLPLVAAERGARWLNRGRDVWFEPQAECLSLVPGRWGVWLRSAFYHLSLARCPLGVGVQFGALITHANTEIGAGAYIGLRSVVGWARVGEGVLIADGVQILSGAHHHGGSGRSGGELRPISLGAGSWIGAGAVVMADVGEGAIVGAGSIVTRPVAPCTIVAGNPARVLQASSAAQSTSSRLTP